MEKILVIGAGTMGAGIAQLVAQAGYDVILQDVDKVNLDKGLASIAKHLGRMADKGELTLSASREVLARIKGTTALEDGQNVDIVLESIVENLELKQQLYYELDRVIQPQAIFASNTSSLSITALGSVTKRPDKVIGMHFFNPPPLMPLLEIIRGAKTAEQTVAQIISFGEKLGKTPIEVAESPGFVFNRLIIPMINEASFLLAEGVASAADIDNALKLGASHKIGPLALADLIGLDVCLAIMEVLQREFGDDKYRPSPLLRKMVRAGQLGRKTGRGFFEYA